MDDRRRFERTKLPPMKLVIEQMISSRVCYKQVVIVLEDISEEGMRFMADISLQQGEIIRFDLPTMAEEALIQARICWVSELESGAYRYGLQLIHDLE
jgi:hypothetical protein